MWFLKCRGVYLNWEYFFWVLFSYDIMGVGKNWSWSVCMLVVWRMFDCLLLWWIFFWRLDCFCYNDFFLLECCVWSCIVFDGLVENLCVFLEERVYIEWIEMGRSKRVGWWGSRLLVVVSFDYVLFYWCMNRLKLFIKVLVILFILKL